MSETKRWAKRIKGDFPDYECRGSRHYYKRGYILNSSIYSDLVDDSACTMLIKVVGITMPLGVHAWLMALNKPVDFDAPSSQLDSIKLSWAPDFCVLDGRKLPSGLTVDEAFDWGLRCLGYRLVTQVTAVPLVNQRVVRKVILSTDSGDSSCNP